MIRALLADRKTMTRRLATSPLRKCAPGDFLWVKENFWQYRAAAGNTVINPQADWPDGWSPAGEECGKGAALTPSIHMPRVASRLTLEVIGLKAQWLHEISYEDIGAEGLTPGARLSFIDLWNKLHGERAWNDNPPVVALTFKVHKCNVDQMAKAA
jgi:hypothetical protein